MIRLSASSPPSQHLLCLRFALRPVSCVRLWPLPLQHKRNLPAILHALPSPHLHRSRPRLIPQYASPRLAHGPQVTLPRRRFLGATTSFHDSTRRLNFPSRCVPVASPLRPMNPAPLDPSRPQCMQQFRTPAQRAPVCDALSGCDEGQQSRRTRRAKERAKDEFGGCAGLRADSGRNMRG